MKKIIQDYLEEQLAFDSALREKYSASGIDKCVEYIIEKAKERLNGKNGYLEDEVVFHFAREYFVDGIAEREELNGLVKKKSATEKKKLASMLDQMEFDFD